MRASHHVGNYMWPQWTLLQCPFLVAHRPKNNRWRVTVSFHHQLKLRHPFCVGTHHACLAHHHHAEAIAGVHPLLRRHVVRGSHGISAHIFQHCQPVPLQPVGKRSADSSVVLMIASAFDLHRLAVEEESFVCIEGYGAHSETYPLSVSRFSTGLDGDYRRVKVRSFRRPECGIRQVRVRGESGGAIGCKGLRHGLCAGYHLSSSVEDLPVHAAILRLPALVLHDRSQIQRRCAALNRSANVALPLSQMQRVGLGQPNMPVDACAFIEPTIAKAGIHAHDQIVPAAII